MGGLAEGVALTDQQRQVVSEHLWLVDLHLRRKVAGLDRRSRAGRSRDDLYQEGCLGLIEAARRYDPGRGIPFVAYALPRIHTAVSRALWRGASMVRMPRRLRCGAADSGAGAAPQIVPLERDPEARPERAEWMGAAETTVETIGQRLRAKYEGAAERAVDVLSQGKDRRGDRRVLLERLAVRRLLVPHEEHRASLREIARQTGSSIARVVQAERRLRERVGELLSVDLEMERLRHEARTHPLGMDAPIDADLHWELRELTERRYMEAFRCLGSEQRSRLVARLLECCGRSVADFVRDLFGSLPREQQDVLLSEARAAG